MADIRRVEKSFTRQGRSGFSRLRYSASPGALATATFAALLALPHTAQAACTPDAATGVDAVCSGVFDEDTPPNGYGSYDIDNVTVLVDSTAVMTPTGAGILLGTGAHVTTEAGSRIEPQPGTINNGVDGIAISGTGTVDHGGAIVTHDEGAFGIVGRAGENFDIRVRETGSIATSGQGAHGINLIYYGGVSGGDGVTMEGTITTSGVGAHGIHTSYGAAGEIAAISVGGDIAVGGDEGSGIYSVLGNGASVDIRLLTGADIGATGADGQGIYLRSGIGAADDRAWATIDVAQGARVFAADGPAIGEGSEAGDNVVINTTLTIAGEVASANAADLAIDLAGGNDSLALLSGYSIIGVVDAGAGNDELVLGGETDSTFDVSDMNVQYLHFENMTKEDSSTWTIAGTSAYDGYFVITGGKLYADAAMADAAFIMGYDVVLGGNGTLGGLSANGGTVAPGHSIGELTVNGSFNMQAASTLEIEVEDSGSNDLVTVNGTVFLRDPTLHVIEIGSFAGTDPFNYLIIDNDGTDAIDGTFGTVVNDFAFLTPSLNYTGGDGNDLALTLTPNNVTPPSGGCTPAAADNVVATCTGTVNTAYGSADADDVTLVVEGGAVLTPSGDAITLGNNANIGAQGGSSIAPTGPGSDGVVLGDYALLDANGRIESTGAGSAAVRLVGTDMGDTAVQEITGVTTVEKARLADQSMNLVNAFATDGGYTGAPGSALPGDPAGANQPDGSAFYNRILAGDTASIESNGGAAAIVSGPHVYIELGQNSTDGLGALLSASSGAAGVLGGEATALLATGATLTSSSDGAALFAITPETDHAGYVGLVDTLASTTGDNSIAFDLGTAANSVATFQSGASTGGVGTTIETLGANSHAIHFGSGSSSTFTATLANTAITTDGTGANGLVVNMGGNSSTSIAMGDSSVATAGGNAFGLDLALGDGGDLNLLLDTSSVATTGDGAGAIRVNSTNAQSTITFVAVDSTISTTGNGAGAVVFADPGDATSPGTSTRTIMFGNTTISTTGDDSHAVYIGDFGTQSAQNLLLDGLAITTQGDRSYGLYIGDIGEGSVIDYRFGDITMTTSGAGAHGLVLGAFDPAAGRNPTLANDALVLGSGMSVTTTGIGADALVIGNNTVLSMPDGLANFDNFVSAGGRSVAVYGTLYTGDGQVITPGQGLVGNISVAGLVEGDTDVAIRYDVDAVTADVFELQPGGTVNGRVEAGNGTDTFVLGGVGSGSFDVALVGNQYLGFEQWRKEDQSIWTLTGTSDFAGPFELTGGTLRANVTMAGTDFNVLSGAVLGGNGILGNVRIDGGTLAPGNSIGTLTTANLVLTSGSTFEVELDDQGNADLVRVSGTVSLGGSTLSLLETGSFAGSDPFNYLIIDNDGSEAVTGTFGNVTNHFAFLTPAVDYAGGDGNDVALTLTPNGASPTPAPSPTPTPAPTPGPTPTPTPTPTPPAPPISGTGLFPTVAATFNQTGSAERLDNLDRADADADDVYMALLFTTVPQALRAFDTASGEIYATMLADQAEAGLGRTRRLVARSHAQAGEGWGMWGGVNGRNGSIDGDGTAAKADHGSHGFELGMDYRGQDNGWALGAGFGYINGNLEIDERLSRADYDGWEVGGYARWGSGNAGATITGAIAYADVHADVKRGVEVNSLSRSASARVDYRTLSLSGEARYGIALGKGGWAAGPLLSIDRGDSDMGTVTERGAASLDLSGGGADHGLTRYGAGLFANWKGTGGGIDLSAQYVDGDSAFAEAAFALRGAPDFSRMVRSPVTDGQGARFAASGLYGLGGGWTIGAETQAVLGDTNSLEGSVTIGFRF